MASGSVGLNITATVLGAPNQPGAAGPGAPGAAVPPYMPPSPSGGSPPGAAVGGGGGGGAGAAAGLAGPEMLALTVVIVAAEMAIDALVDTAKALDGVFNDVAKTAKNYNAEVAVATAMADVRSMLTDLEQANQLGPSLAGYVDARAEMAQSLKRIETELLEVLLPIAEQVVRLLTGMLEALRQMVDVPAMAKQLLDFINNTPLFQGLLVGALGFLFNPLIALLKKIAANTAPPVTPQWFKDYEDFINPNSPQNQAPMGNPAFAPPPIGKP